MELHALRLRSAVQPQSRLTHARVLDGAAQHSLSGTGEETFRNFPVFGVQDDLREQRGSDKYNFKFIPLASLEQPFTGVAFSYVWWMVAFQLVVGVLLASAAAATPRLRHSAMALITILTMSCFLLTQSVCNAYMGAYMLSHNASGTPASVLNGNSEVQHLVNGVMVLFSGAVVCSVADALTLVFLGVAVYDETAASKAAERAAAPGAYAA